MVFDRYTVRQVLLLGLSFVLSVAASLGCGGRQNMDEEELEAMRPMRARTGNLRPEAFRAVSDDLNGDGRADQTTYYDGSIPRWVERDLDFDGSVDLYEHFEGGVLVEQEFQLDFDAAIDVVRVYRGGVLFSKELATGFDATASLFKFYNAAGQLLRVESDLDRDGVLDAWQYYEGGRLVRLARDTDGDGEPDTIEDVD